MLHVDNKLSVDWQPSCCIVVHYLPHGILIVVFDRTRGKLRFSSYLKFYVLRQSERLGML